MRSRGARRGPGSGPDLTIFEIPGELVVRLARAQDVAEIGALAAGAYVGAGFVSEDDEYVGELRDAAGRREGAELWVAAVADRICGTVTYCPPGSVYRELAAPGEGEFRMLAVVPEARGKGIARALVRRCLERTAELGLNALVLCSMVEMTPAHALYVASGFRRDPALDWEPVPGVRLVGFRATI